MSSAGDTQHGAPGAAERGLEDEVAQQKNSFAVESRPTVVLEHDDNLNEARMMVSSDGLAEDSAETAALTVPDPVSRNMEFPAQDASIPQSPRDDTAVSSDFAAASQGDISEQQHEEVLESKRSSGHLDEKLTYNIVPTTVPTEEENAEGRTPLKTVFSESLRTQPAVFGIAQPKAWRLMYSNPIGKMCYKITANPWFDRFVIAVILFNCVLIARQNEGVVETELGDRLEMFFAVFFTVEAVLKILSWGLTYFRDGWNIFDFAMVLIA